MTAFDPIPFTYRARWIWSEGRWIEDGRVTVVGRQIVAVTTERQPDEIDLGEQLILPGLVNAHTHLEFSRLAAPLPYDETFAGWIRHVVQWRREQAEADSHDAIQQGLVESTRAGVTLLGEITTHSWNSDTFAPDAVAAPLLSPALGPQLVVFHEVLGLKLEAVPTQLANARRHLIRGDAELHEASPQQQLSWRAGLSPHAPYSLSSELFAESLDLARQRGCPVAMHLAETREELDLLASGTGPLVDLFTEWGLWSPGQRAAFGSPLEVLQQLSVLPRVLVIHGNYLTRQELDFLTGKDQFSIVYCPRTHSYFQHERYPLAAMLQRGIRVALGTDSRASNPDLNLLSEVRHVAQLHPEIAPATLLEMATHHGSEALGLGKTVGRIVPGQRADLCVLPIAPGIHDPFEAVLAP